MTFIDTNLTFSKQTCDFAVGGIIGGASVLYFLGRLLIILLGFYVVYRVTKIFLIKREVEIKIQNKRVKHGKN
jgi:hypothetical protein